MEKWFRRTKEHEIQPQLALVPFDGSPESIHGLRLACEIAKHESVELRIVYVIEVKRSQALDVDLEDKKAQGEEILAQAKEIARNLDVKIEDHDFELLQAREASHAIIEDAFDSKAQNIIIGTKVNNLDGVLGLGSVAMHILSGAPCRVTLVRSPLVAAQNK